MNWTFADRTADMKRSTIREILKLTAQPDIISFAGGLPAPEHFPVERIRQAADTVLRERGREALQYSTTEGLPELRDFLARRLSTDGFSVSRDNIVIVGGSQQALDLIGRVYLNPGEGVMVENPSYLGMLMAWKGYQVNFLPVDTDSEGMDINAAAQVMAHRPRMIYSVPNFQNPGGITLSRERREKLVRLLAQHSIPLVEDHAYSELRYSGESIPPLLHLDAAHLGKDHLDGHVIYCGTFSKILAPGLRLGWVAAPLPVIDKIVQAKQSADLHTSTLTQLVAYEAARDGFLDSHIAHLRTVYRQRRDVMLAAMERFFPEGVTWTRPEGGLFLMVRLPAQLDSADLLHAAIARCVAFIPGRDFHVGDVGRNTLRLNFSNAAPEMIEEGIRRLGEVIKNALLK